MVITDKIRINKLNADKILDDQQPEQLLRDLGLTVGSEIVSKVIAVLARKNSLYEIYISKDRRDGSHRIPVCAKGTVYKIKRLYVDGKLNPYIDYLNQNNMKPDITKKPTESKDESNDPEKQRQQTDHIKIMQELARKAFDGIPLDFPDFQSINDPEFFAKFNFNIVKVVRRLVGDSDWSDLAAHLGEEGIRVEAISKTTDDILDGSLLNLKSKASFGYQQDLAEIWFMLKFKGLKTISEYSDTREWERHGLNQRCPGCKIK